MGVQITLDRKDLVNPVTSERPLPQDSTTGIWPEPKLLAIALVASGVSIAIQGFHFGIANNVYHVPLVLDWAGEPAFSHDRFIQSLRDYFSAWWWMVRQVATQKNVVPLFLVMHFFSRWAGIVGLVIGARSLGLTSKRMQIALTFWFGVTPLLSGASVLGGDGLFLEYFTHTELTHPLALVGIALAAKGEIGAAIALDGLIFDINAFVGVWIAVAIAAAGIGLIRVGKFAWLTAGLRAVFGLAVALLLAAPVIGWIYSVMHGQPPYQAFDYAEFLRVYYPYHFFIEASGSKELVNFAALVVSGYAALELCGTKGIIWKYAYLGFCLVFVLGTVLPEFTHSGLFLDLTLLRVAGKIQLVTILTLSVVSAMFLQRDGFPRVAGAASLVILSLPLAAGALLSTGLLWKANRRTSVVSYLLAAAGIVAIFVSLDWAWPQRVVAAALEIGIAAGIIVFASFVANWNATRKLVITATMTTAIVVSACITFLNFHKSASEQANSFLDVSRWANGATPSKSTFLVPLNGNLPESEFQIVLHRPIWVDWAHGGAVGWMPSYHEEWARRYTDVGQLKTLNDQLKYACVNHIDYVVYGRKSDTLKREDAIVAFENAHFIVVNVSRQWCTHAATARL